MHIGKKIKEIRESKKMSQNDLALIAGYKSRQSIHDVELNSKPRNNVVRKIANALEVDPKIFYSDLEIVEDASVSYNVKKDRMEYLLEEVRDIWSKMLDENERLRSINKELKSELKKKT